MEILRTLKKYRRKSPAEIAPPGYFDTFQPFIPKTETAKAIEFASCLVKIADISSIKLQEIKVDETTPIYLLRMSFYEFARTEMLEESFYYLAVAKARLRELQQIINNEDA